MLYVRGNVVGGTGFGKGCSVRRKLAGGEKGRKWQRLTSRDSEKDYFLSFPRVSSDLTGQSALFAQRKRGKEDGLVSGLSHL